MQTANLVNSLQSTLSKGFAMSENDKPFEWISLSQAEQLPECEVTRRTLKRMMERGDVPEEHYKITLLADGKRHIVIDKNILSKLKYRGRGEYKRRKD